MNRYAIDQLLASLNEEQLKAVNVGGGKAALIGAPGSGKTRCLMARIARMVAAGFPGRYIAAITFTKAAAWEMNKRLAMLGIEDCRVGTIHSLSLQILSEDWPAASGLRLVDEYRMEAMVGQTIGYLKREGLLGGFKPRAEAVAAFIENCKATGICYIEGDPLLLNDAAEYRQLDLARAWSDEAKCAPLYLVRLYKFTEERRASNFVWTYDDMQLWSWMYLLVSAHGRLKWRQRWSVVILDEAQDSTAVQWDLARLLTGIESWHMQDLDRASRIDAALLGGDDQPHNLMVAGDPSQCQPPGTLIEIEGEKIGVGKGWRGKRRRWDPIEEIRAGSLIRSWSRNQQDMVTRRVNKVAKRRYAGPILSISTSTSTTRVTPNHRFICRWSGRESNVCVTYLMWRRDLGYRVGWCKLFTGKHGFHLSQRARLEKADALWILKAHDTRAEASLEESRIAAHYGLPTITFEAPNGSRLYTRSSIKKLFEDLGGENKQRGERCLQDLGRDPKLPFWPWPKKPRGAYSRGTYFEVFAANLLPKIMCVPIPEGRNCWAVINRIESRPYRGYVYSLDVDQDHSYVADGIVVLNSIYLFRYARPDDFVSFATSNDVELCPLPRNYRSIREICDLSYEVVQRFSWHLVGPIVSERGPAPKPAVELEQFNDITEEASGVLRWCLEAAEGRLGSCAVLCRLSAFLSLVEMECITNRVPYIKRARGSFTDSYEVKDVLAYMRVINESDPDDKAVRRVINAPNRYISRAVMDSACSSVGTEAGINRSLDILSAVARDGRISLKQTREISSLRGMLENLYLMQPNPAAAISEVLRSTDYLEKLKARRQEEIDSSKVAMVGVLQGIARPFKSITDFLVYISQLRAAIRSGQRQLQRSEGGNHLTLSTIHGAKGLEWPNVVVADVVAGRCPCSWSLSYDEEVRLFYVGISRAANRVLVAYSIGEESEESPFVSLVRQALKRGPEEAVYEQVRTAQNP